MAYTVIHDFIDKADDRHAYKVGDEYPRAGFKVSADTLKELASSNKFRPALIEGSADKPKEAPAKETEAEGAVAEVADDKPKSRKRSVSKKEAE